MADDREPRNIETAPSAASAERARAGRKNLERGRAERARKQADARARREAGESKRIDLYREGRLPLSEWTDEELQRGRPSNIDGGFSGVQPRFTAKEHSAIKRELLARGTRMLDSMYFDAIKVLHSVATDPVAPESARVKAASLIIERTAGRVPEKIEIKSSDPWQDILDEVLDDEVLPPVGRQVEVER